MRPPLGTSGDVGDGCDRLCVPVVIRQVAVGHELPFVPAILFGRRGRVVQEAVAQRRTRRLLGRVFGLGKVHRKSVVDDGDLRGHSHAGTLRLTRARHLGFLCRMIWCTLEVQMIGRSPIADRSAIDIFVCKPIADRSAIECWSL